MFACFDGESSQVGPEGLLDLQDRLEGGQVHVRDALEPPAYALSGHFEGLINSIAVVLPQDQP